MISNGTENDTSTCVNINFLVIDDDIVEYTEYFTINLANSNPPVEIVEPLNTTVFILDNDSKPQSHLPVLHA